MLALLLLGFLQLSQPTLAWLAGGGGTAVTQTTWTQWFSLSLSRGIYFVLAALIFLCLIYTVIKNKFGESPEELDVNPSNWLATIWKVAGCDKYSGCSSTSFRTVSYRGNEEVDKVQTKANSSFLCPYFNKFRNQKRYSFSGMLGTPLGIESELSSETEMLLKEKLRSAESEVSALRGELESSHKSRLELENNLEILDKDKMSVEERLELERVSGTMELEDLKKENASANLEIERLKTEKKELGNEMEVLKRDASINSRALRDNQILQLKLEEAKTEIDALRKQMSGIQQERDVATVFLKEIMSRSERCVPYHLDTSVPNSIILTDLMLMVDNVGDPPRQDLIDIEDNESTEVITFQNERGEGEQGQRSLDEGEAWLRKRRAESAAELPDGDSRMVTDSPFFRSFLEQTFPQEGEHD